MSINRTKVSILISPLIPDVDVIILEIPYVCVAIQEPKQLIYDSLQIQFLCGQKWESVCKIVAALCAKDANCTSSCPVSPFNAIFSAEITHV